MSLQKCHLIKYWCKYLIIDYHLGTKISVGFSKMGNVTEVKYRAEYVGSGVFVFHVSSHNIFKLQKSVMK